MLSVRCSHFELDIKFFLPVPNFRGLRPLVRPDSRLVPKVAQPRQGIMTSVTIISAGQQPEITVSARHTLSRIDPLIYGGFTE